MYIHGYFACVLLLLASGCDNSEAIPKEAFINQWWSMEKEEVSFYLQHSSLLVYYSYWEPYPHLESNIQDGFWEQLDSNSFLIDIMDMEVEVQATLRSDGCYDITHWPKHDIACRLYIEVTTNETL